MARRSIPMIEFDEVFFRSQQGQNISQIARSLGQARDTVRKYLRLGIQAGLSVGGDEAERGTVRAVVHQRSAARERLSLPPLRSSSTPTSIGFGRCSANPT